MHPFIARKLHSIFCTCLLALVIAITANPAAAQSTKAPAVCRFAGQTIAHGQSITAYERGRVQWNQSCVAEQRTCHNGRLSGSFSRAGCEVKTPLDCEYNGQTLKHGATITGYLKSKVSFGETCQSQIRQCINGRLTHRTFQESSCQVEAAKSCSAGNRTIAHGAQATFFTTSGVGYGQACQTENRTCNNGTLSGSATFASCTTPPARNCSLDGRATPHGAKATFFTTSAVPYGQNCPAQERTCNDGSFSGSAEFRFSRCTGLPARDCSINGQTVSHGSKITLFTSTGAPSGSSCVSEDRTCNNGTLSGSATFPTCTTPPKSCSVNGQTIAHGTQATFFTATGVPFGQTCQTENRTCNNGTLSGSATGRTCNVALPRSCSINGQTIAHGSKTKLFMTASVGSGQQCQTEERICNDGTLSGSATQTSCNMQAAYTNRTGFEAGAFTLKAGERAEFEGQMLTLQGDCNLVHYDENKVAQWSSRTAGQCKRPLAHFGTDGRLTITDLDTNKVLFSTPAGIGNKLRLSKNFPYASIHSNELRTDGLMRRLVWAGGLRSIGANTTPSLTPLVLNKWLLDRADFLIQDVCVDSAGVATNGDPATCTNRRNLRIGEPIPYTMTDRAWNQAYQWVHNAPLLYGMSVRVANKREFGANSRPGNQQSLRAFGDFNLTDGDGFDIVEIDGDLVSAVGTRDPNTLDLNFHWFNADCRREDGWVFFPNNLAKGTQASMVAKLKGGTSCVPNNQYSQSLTTWHYYKEPMLYTNGKKLETIQSHHFGNGDPSRDLDHIEVFYFTREYGLSRWERWGRHPLNHDGHAKSGACNGPLKINQHGQDFWRHDCRDWTTVRTISTPTQPYDIPLHREFATSRNLLVSGDFASYQIGAWRKLSESTYWTGVEDALHKNVSLEIACGNLCKQESVYQDVDLRSVLAEYNQAGYKIHLNIQAGLNVTAPAGGRVNVVVHRWGPGNQYYEPGGLEVALPAANSAVPIQMTIPVDMAKEPLERVRLEVYMLTNGVKYRIDDAFLAVLPAQ